MRIAIVTFHSSQNYGAVLQCYALQTVLIEMGHDIEIIDRYLISLIYHLIDLKESKRSFSLITLSALEKNS